MNHDQSIFFLKTGTSFDGNHKITQSRKQKVAENISKLYNFSQVFRSPSSNRYKKVMFLGYFVPLIAVVVNAGVAIGYFDKRQKDHTFCQEGRM